MSWMPGAAKLPVPISRQHRRRLSPATLILHSGVMNKRRWVSKLPQSLRGYFSTSPLESHFFVAADGRIEQYVPLDLTADANYLANPWAISIETEDDGDPDRTPWTEAQIESMAKIAAYVNRHYKVPLRQTQSVWDSGINGHSAHGSPSLWSKYRGKTCPGVARKKQIPEVIAKARVLASPGQPTADVNPPIPPVEKKLKVLGRGDQGEQVRQLQKVLNTFFGTSLSEDGDFGIATESAVRSIQSKFGTTPDGLYGDNTRAVLRKFKSWVAEVELP